MTATAPLLRCIAFDCFGTLFDMSGVPKEEIADYVRHVNRDDFTPYDFPETWFKLPAHADVRGGFDDLRSLGVRLLALSNGSRGLIESLATTNGFKFDHIVDLTRHRVYKPHRGAYMAVERDTAYKPDETLMVTANPTFGDLEGAASVGMRSQVIRHGHPNTVVELAEMLGA
jgi:2-haloalkanoic acid dehalogenase type II